MTEIEYQILSFISSKSHVTGVDILNHFCNTCLPANMQELLASLFSDNLISSDKGFGFDVRRKFKLTAKGHVSLTAYEESLKRDWKNYRKKNHPVANDTKEDKYKIVEIVLAIIGAIASLVGIIDFFLK